VIDQLKEAGCGSANPMPKIGAASRCRLSREASVGSRRPLRFSAAGADGARELADIVGSPPAAI
jgi:hypothetical protein